MAQGANGHSYCTNHLKRREHIFKQGSQNVKNSLVFILDSDFITALSDYS